MTGSTFVIAALVLVASAFFLAKRGLRYLQFFQQEGYDGVRFFDWYKREANFDRRGSGVFLLAVLIMFIVGYQSTVAAMVQVLASLVLIVIAFTEPDPRFGGKLPLNMTSRATRIYCSYLVLMTLGLPLVYFGAVAIELEVLGLMLFQIFLFQLAPFLVVLANKMLEPYEQWTQKKYLEEAKNAFKNIAPYTIGITGSYGKTTTKNILGQLLQGGLGSTFWPEKGINTPMGITRVLRTRLKAHHKYAVIEMGAYRIGSIKRLCKLTPPDAAIITAVGIMHLDRFKGQENIYKGKSELAQAIPETGILVCNGDNEGARRMATEFKKKTTLLYGLDENAGPLDCRGSDVRTLTDGTGFTIHWNGKQYETKMPLFGMAAVSNVLASFTMAVALGVKPEYVVALIASLEQVDNRLFLDTQSGIHFFRDAYNSNPTGFEAALEVLKNYPSKRRVLITPGMIELGEKQYEENKRLASLAAKTCDLVYVVSDVNREAFIAGLTEGGAREDAFKIFDDRTGAFEALGEEQKPGDAILIENDLPDVLETRESF